MNRAAAELFRQEDEKVGVELELESRVPANDLETLDTCLQDRKAYCEVEFQIISSPDDLRPVKFAGTRTLRDGVPELSGCVIPCNEETIMQERLRLSEERLRIALDATQVGVWDWDLEKDYWYASPNYFTILGYKAEMGFSDRSVWLNRVHPDDRKSVEGKIMAVLQSGLRNYSYEARMLHVDGSYRWHQVIGAIVRRNDQSEPTRMVGIRRDIHSQKIAEEELKASQKRLRTLIDTIPDLVWLKDPHGVYLQCNERFENLYGVPEAKIIGKVDYDFVTPELADYFRLKDNEAIQRRKPLRFEESVPFADGHEEILETIKTPIFQPDGTLLGVLGIARDITEKKKNESDLEAYRKHLEELVGQRTEELNRSNEDLQQANAELRTKQKELQKTLDHLRRTQDKLVQSEKLASLGILSAGIAHEINNPLNFISGSSLALESLFSSQSEETAKEAAPFFGAINSGVARAAEIVKSLGHYCSQDYSPKLPINPHEVLDNCLVMLQANLKGRIDVQKDYQDSDFRVDGTEGELHQVFLNILSNAEQSIDGNGRITLRTWVKKDKYNIAITDTGIGIPPHRIRKIFDPFYTTKTPGKGMGLGLSICHKIITEHSGAIDIESAPGQGTKITITLPVAN